MDKSSMREGILYTWFVCEHDIPPSSLFSALGDALFVQVMRIAEGLLMHLMYSCASSILQISHHLLAMSFFSLPT